MTAQLHSTALKQHPGVMQYQAIIFDLDGTLLDTLEDIADAMNVVLADCGLPPHPIQAYRDFIGSGAAELVRRALPPEHRNPGILQHCLGLFRASYGRNWHAKTGPYVGIEQMLDAVSTRGLKMAVLSNKPHDFTVRCVDTLLSRWTFNAVLGQQPGMPPKPDPTGALKIAKLLKIKPHRFVFVGDSAADVKTAIEAGMTAAAATWGFRPAAELKSAGARVLLHKPSDILALLS